MHELRRNIAIRQELVAYITGRIDTLRARLEGDMNERDTAKLRGRIAELKALMAALDNAGETNE